MVCLHIVSLKASPVTGAKSRTTVRSRFAPQHCALPEQTSAKPDQTSTSSNDLHNGAGMLSLCQKGDWEEYIPGITIVGSVLSSQL